jgi:saccharopine dehydrogenase-like NADP-dependent oxidoreductase
MPYAETYAIQPTDWMFRGTLRNVGWCATLKKIAEMGYFDDTPFADRPATFRELTAQLLDVSPDTDLPQYLAGQWAMCDDAKPITDLEWLGLFSDEPLPESENTCLDALAAQMQAKLAYKPGERDLIVMQHQFVAEYSDRKEAITATMIDYGIPNGDTSMARTVGLPAAIAVRLILQGEFADLSGVQVPMIPEIYEPVLAELSRLGIGLTEKVEVI